MTDVARLVLDADTRGLRAGRRELQDVARQSRNTASDVDRSSSNMSSAFGRVKSSIIPLAAGFAGAAFSIQSLIGTNARFGASMQRVAAISGATGAELSELRQTAKDLGASTEFSASQAAEGLAFLSQAGFTASESVAAIPSVLSLATAGSLELASAADIASNVLSGFGKEAGDAGIVADVLASAASSTNTSVSQLGQAMSTVAPIAASLGISMEETAAAIGVMSDAGIQGERAGTALRGVFASLAGPTTQAQEALARYGLTASDVDPQTEGLSNALGLLAERGLTTADAMTIFGREAASGALVVAEAAGRVGELTEQFENADGAAQDMADTIADNLNGDINALRSAFEGVVISIGDNGVSGGLRSLAQTATATLRLINENLTLVMSTVAGAVIGWGTYRLAIIASTQVTTSMITQFSIFRGAVVSTTSSVGALAGAKVALTGAAAGATAAARSLTAALLPTPFGAAALAVGILSAAFIGLAQSQATARAETDNLIRSLNAAGRAGATTFEETENGIKSAERLAVLQKRLANARQQANQIQAQSPNGATDARLSTFQSIIRNTTSEIQQLQVATTGAKAAFNETRKSIKDVEVPAARSAAAISANGKAASGLSREAGQTKEKIDELGNSLTNLERRLFPVRTIVSEYRSDQDLLKRSLDASRISADQYASAMSRLTAEFVRNGRAFDQGSAPSVLSGDDTLKVDVREVGKELDILVGRTEDGTGKVSDSFQDMATSITNSLQSLSNSIRSGGFLDIIGSVIGTFSQLASSGVLGGDLQTTFASNGGGGGGAPIPSFDGGGFTGGGARSGGLDGRGGFMAMLHPNETVTDHTRGQGGGSVVVINNSAMADVFVDGRIQNAAPALANAGATMAGARQSRLRRRAVPR